MAEKEIVNKTRNEIAASDDNIPLREPRIYESGCFFLSQQIISLRDSMDTKFDSMRKETEGKISEIHKEIKDLSDKTDAGFDKVDAKIDSMRKEFNDKFNNLQRWAFGLIITVVLAFVAIYFK